MRLRTRCAGPVANPVRGEVGRGSTQPVLVSYGPDPARAPPEVAPAALLHSAWMRASPEPTSDARVGRPALAPAAPRTRPLPPGKAGVRTSAPSARADGPQRPPARCSRRRLLARLRRASGRRGRDAFRRVPQGILHRDGDRPAAHLGRAAAVYLCVSRGAGQQVSRQPGCDRWFTRQALHEARRARGCGSRPGRAWRGRGRTRGGSRQHPIRGDRSSPIVGNTKTTRSRRSRVRAGAGGRAGSAAAAGRGGERRSSRRSRRFISSPRSRAPAARRARS